MTSSRARPPINSTSIWGIISFAFSTCFGIASIASTAVAYDMSYMSAAHVAALLTGALAFVSAIIAYPLTYVGGSMHMRQHTSRGINGLMIASWVMFSIFVMWGGIILCVGAAVGVEVGWGVAIVIWMMLGWSLMFLYAELARRSPVLNSTGQSTRTIAFGSSNGLSKSEPVTIELRVNPDGTQTTIKRTLNPDGSVTVEETKEERVVVKNSISHATAPPEEEGLVEIEL